MGAENAESDRRGWFATIPEKILSSDRNERKAFPARRFARLLALNRRHQQDGEQTSASTDTEAEHKALLAYAKLGDPGDCEAVKAIPKQ